MAYQRPGRTLFDGLQNGPLLERLGDERRLPEGLGQIGGMRSRHESEWDAPRRQLDRKPETLAPDHVDIEQRVVEAVFEMRMASRRDPNRPAI